MADTTQLNREYFNDEAAEYDSKHAKATEDITKAIRARLNFIGVNWAEADKDVVYHDKPVRLLDYACGTGSITRALAPYLTECVGIDISENMVAAYNARAEEQADPKPKMHAVTGNLCVANDPSPASLSGPEYHDFDIAAVGGGFHHFDNPELAASRLVERLRPGGVLVIWDFLPFEEDADTGRHGVTVHGFTRERIQEVFEKGGAGKGFGLQEMEVEMLLPNGSQRTLFLARGERA